MANSLSKLSLVSCLTLFAPLCFGRPKTDTVTLVNGNDITCEIRGLSRGVLNAKTDSLSSISIRWQDVRQIRSEFQFEIILTNGTTHYGVLATDPAGDLQIPGGTAVPLLQIVSLTPINERFVSRLDGAVDFGYNFQKSNATTQVNFDGEGGYTTRRRSLQLDYSSLLVVRNGATTTDRNQADLNLNQTLSRNWFALVIGQFASNEQLDLMHRYLGGGGLGRYLVRTNHSIVSAYTGGAYSTERYSSDEKRNNAEVLLGVNAQFFRLYSPKLDITGDFRFWPNISSSDRYRIDANAKARVEVYKNLFVSISFFDNYDQKNPTTAMPRNDYGVIMSVGYSFNR
jgi:hypothetical protein